MVNSRPRILVVDDSRIVRAALVRHLQEHYDVREEADGEAGWQALVLDQTLLAVISDLQMPRLDGYGLLERVRSSKLKRLQEMPFLLVSGEERETDLDRAKRLGASEFISKGSGTAEILTRVDNLISLNRARRSVDEGREQRVQDPDTGLFTRKYIELQLAQALSHAARHDGEVSVMVLGFDHFAQISEQLGPAAAGQVTTRFAKLLTAKIRREDSLGHFQAGQYVIVSPGVSPALCASFAERVREAVEVAHVSAHGQRLTLTVSVGVANVPADKAVSAGVLLDLAAERMQAAMAAGGNRIIAGGQPAAAPARLLGLAHALELLRAGRPEAVQAHLPRLGLQILPLLQALNSEYSLNLPLADLERIFSERTRSPEKTGP